MTGGRHLLLSKSRECPKSQHDMSPKSRHKPRRKKIFPRKTRHFCFMRSGQFLEPRKTLPPPGRGKGQPPDSRGPTTRDTRVGYGTAMVFRTHTCGHRSGVAPASVMETPRTAEGEQTIPHPPWSGISEGPMGQLGGSIRPFISKNH